MCIRDRRFVQRRRIPVDCDCYAFQAFRHAFTLSFRKVNAPSFCLALSVLICVRFPDIPVLLPFCSFHARMRPAYIANSQYIPVLLFHLHSIPYTHEQDVPSTSACQRNFLRQSDRTGVLVWVYCFAFAELHIYFQKFF